MTTEAPGDVEGESGRERVDSLDPVKRFRERPPYATRSKEDVPTVTHRSSPYCRSVSVCKWPNF